MIDLFSKRFKLGLLAVSVVCICFLSFIKFTDACKLKDVSLNSNSIDKWDTKYGLNPSASILSQPIDSLAETLLSKSSIFKVDIDYNLFNKIEIETNKFDPVCFVLDNYSQTLYGLTDRARIIGLDNCEFEWDRPVLTSVAFNKLYDYCLDMRVTVIVPQLEQLREKNPDLFQMIEEIDFGNRRFVKVTVAGLPYRLKLKTESFLNDLDKFVDFVTGFNPDLQNVNIIDLRFEDMIITGRTKS